MNAPVQRFSIFHDNPEAKLKAWHFPYARLYSGARSVLDVGCGSGMFLDILREQGVRGVGLDMDPAMVAMVKNRGHEAFEGTHQDIAKCGDAFDGVHISHVIEHLWGDDALKLMENAAGVLAPGGVLVIRTPNWRNKEIRTEGFWLDHTHKRPYPPQLLNKLATDLGLVPLAQGTEPFGWEDVYFIASKRGAKPIWNTSSGLEWKTPLPPRKPLLKRIALRLLRFATD